MNYYNEIKHELINNEITNVDLRALKDSKNIALYIQNTNAKV